MIGPLTLKAIRKASIYVANTSSLKKWTRNYLSAFKRMKKEEKKGVFFFFFVVGDSAYFNQGLRRSIFFSDFLEVFSRKVYCPLRF